MEIKTHFSPQEVLNNPELTQDAMNHCGELTYEMTDGEIDWVNFIKGKYSIADYILKRMVDNVVTIDMDFSKSLDDDCEGAGKAVMLSDDSALQSIFFYNYMES